ncbi:alkylhydroperoxidase domain protein [Microbacterium sp. LRZ72]|uniref:alkylhydroperoxidase domain protein n=1 Tax=Microbacterium sp. LRZ72 TaxID=2942481 RepID=UPI0029AB9D96|nr:alkylhydroperoxidase domain protein [Microbacterium sp. LRZ72]MDX2375244.1 alkylhydroperoxidase domain protein [Microbacterium sp. LRZ72]
MTDSLAPETPLDPPPAFTQQLLNWRPWLHPLPEEEFEERHYEALVQRSRVRNEYFRLLARDPDVLRERTLTDFDIFFNTDAGLDRAGREIAATVASRVNGCVYCASVHAGFATHHSAREQDVQRLLDEGVSVRLDPRWDAIIDAAAALTATPPTFSGHEVAALEQAGMDELEVLDAVMAGAFFNWANRLMLSIGEPTR